MQKYIGHALTLVTVIIGLGGTWWTFAGEQADAKRRLLTLEERQKEDREERRRDVKEVKQDVKDVKIDVQTILRKLDTIEAGQKAAERRAR